MTGRVPTGGTRQAWRRAVAGTHPVRGVVTAAALLALLLAVPAGTATATSSRHKTVKVSTAKVTGIGTVLTTASGLTLYRFTEDTPGTSSCTGACAKIWPPLLASQGAHVSGPKGVKGLAVTNVGNGRWQVAYHKIPLYRFEGDMKKGQANGQNVGKVWFAAMKSGIPASNAAPLAASSTSTSQAPTPTTQGSGSSTPAPAVTPTTRAPAPPPTTAPPTSPPATTPPASPPTTTPTTAAGGGGYGY